MIRGAPAIAVIRPNVPALKFVDGIAPVEGVEQIERLHSELQAMASQRERALDTARSTVQNPGPLNAVPLIIAQCAWVRLRERGRVQVARHSLVTVQVIEHLIHPLLLDASERVVPTGRDIEPAARTHAEDSRHPPA